MIARCQDCRVSLGRQTARDEGRVLRCTDCETQHRGKWMLRACPDPDGDHDDQEAWGMLSDWEQDFLVSVRARVERGQRITENQYQALERIYDKID